MSNAILCQCGHSRGEHYSAAPYRCNGGSMNLNCRCTGFVLSSALQARVGPWLLECFGAAVAGNKVERGDRLLEEVLELLQSNGYERWRIAALVEYVYGRPAGEPAQEVGGVMITLAAYCLAFGLDMHECGEAELARIWTKVEQIRAKQAAKMDDSSLPGPTP